MTIIQTKLKAVKLVADDKPGLKAVTVNPDGEEASKFIDNMIYHMGHIIKMALEHADEETANLIKKHAHSAIKGEP